MMSTNPIEQRRMDDAVRDAAYRNYLLQRAHVEARQSPERRERVRQRWEFIYFALRATVAKQIP
jgi:hypothetical protein